MRRKITTLLLVGFISLACSQTGAVTSTVDTPDQPAQAPVTAQDQPTQAPTTAFNATNVPEVVESVNLDEGLLAYYPFDGDGLEDSRRESVAELFNITTAADRFGMDNRALRFNGVDSVVVIPDDDRLELTDDFSISFFIQGNSDSNHEWLIMTKHQAGQCQPATTSWMLRYDASNGLRLVNYDTTVECGKTVLSVPEVFLGDNLWHHLVIVRQGDAISLYMDAVLITTMDASVLNIQNNSHALVIGNQTNGIPTHNLDAVFDDLRFYDRAIDYEMVFAIFNAAP